MRVLFADKLADQARTALASAGIEVRAEPGLKDDTLVAALAEFDPEVLVVRSTKVREAHIAAGRALSLVVRAGAGVNTIDLAACAAAGVFVANCPGRNAVAVAELTLGLALAIDRRIPDNVAALREGRWDKKGFSQARGLKGRTLGLIGMGRGPTWGERGGSLRSYGGFSCGASQPAGSSDPARLPALGPAG